VAPEEREFFPAPGVANERRMRHERLWLVRFASWIEQVDECEQTKRSRTKGSLRTAESRCGQSPPGRGGIGALQNGHERWPGVRYLPGGLVHVPRLVTTQEL
jgi:hypothetical protein